MSTPDYPDAWYDIDTALYHRSVKIFNAVKKMLGVKMKLHGNGQADIGDIFLFNHFSRLETFIPQFLIFEQTGAYSFAIASGEFFKKDTLLANYLQKVGAIPHDHQCLFTVLASQILRGRKVIIFPEGGMVKDHRVIDNQGRYGIYSRISGERRKQHTGAAVLAQGLELFKAAIRHAYSNNNQNQLLHWQKELRFDSLEQLRLCAAKPTVIIPANITFYPIRASENWLSQSVDFFTDNLSFRLTEELLVESNLLLKNTDMDIRLGQPIEPYDISTAWSRHLVETLADDFRNLDQVFNLSTTTSGYKQRLLASYFKKTASAIRNRYMRAIYANVTINLSHLAATLIMHSVEHGRMVIKKQDFFTTLYIAVKHLQLNTTVYLHRSLLNPLDYSELTTGTNKPFQQFICVAKDSELLIEHNDSYEFLPKLLEEQDFDHIRLENLIAVYNNEVKPIAVVRDAIINALAQSSTCDKQQLAAWYFDDECRDFIWECRAFQKNCYDDINAREMAEADAAPFFLTPDHSNGFGVLLIHGLLASPAELKGYGHYLVQQGYTVLGVRLPGHGSSPCALSQKSWEDWYASVQRGFHILTAYCSRIFVSGFSTGGALALKLAAEKYPQIMGVSATAVPIKFINPAFMLVPLLHGANTLVDWLSLSDGIKPFFENDSEHPQINYHQVPVKSLYELRRLIDELNQALPAIKVPVLIVQADHDPIVSFDSATDIISKLSTTERQLAVIPANRHGILMENLGGTWATIDRFMAHCQTINPYLNVFADRSMPVVIDKTSAITTG